MRRLATSATIGLLATLTACGGGDRVVYVAAPTLPPTTTAAPTTTQALPEPTAEDRYLAGVAEMDDSYLLGLGMTELLEYGYLVCDFFDSGGTKDQLIQLIIQSGTGTMSKAQMLAYAGAAGIAVAELCPRNGWKIA